MGKVTKVPKIWSAKVKFLKHSRHSELKALRIFLITKVSNQKQKESIWLDKLLFGFLNYLLFNLEN